MDDENPFERHIVSMMAIGRLFKIGDLYDYCTDRILTDIQSSWDPATLDSATQKNFPRLEKQSMLFPISEFSNKARAIGLDHHMQQSVFAGLIETNQGAINYLNDWSSPGEVTCTITCRTKSFEENLNLWSLVSQVPSLRIEPKENEENLESSATHIVTGVFYGAELHCVLSQKIDVINEVDEENKNNIMENLTTLADKWRCALDELESVAKFKERFLNEDIPLITQLKCRLYADLQIQPVIECCFFDAYETALELMESVCSSGFENEKCVPIAVRLCSLDVLMDSCKRETNERRYRDVGMNPYVHQCFRLLTELNNSIVRAERLYAENKESTLCKTMPEFISSISLQKEWLKDVLKKLLVKERRCINDRSGYVEIRLNKSIAKFERFLDLKTEELDKKKKENFSLKIHRLPYPPTGLRISHPTSAIHRPAKRAKPSSSSLLIEWNYQDLGYPSHFLVEYRGKDSTDPWMQRTTESGQTQLEISFEIGSTVEVRVAAETCIGRSEFSQVVDSFPPIVKIQNFPPPKKENAVLLPPIGLTITSVSHNLAELDWTTAPNEDYDVLLKFRVDYWQKGQVPTYDTYATYSEAPCILGGLKPETTYLLTVSTIAENESQKSAPNDPVEFTTSKEVRFPEKFVTICKKVASENGVDRYAVPLTKLNGRPQTAQRFVIGETKIRSNLRENPAILLIGSSNVAKISIINAMINYVFNANEDDPFCFQLIDPSSQESRNVIIYHIDHADGLRFNSLTIIDTPSYVEDDPEKNKEITELIRNYFDDPDCIQKVDMVAFIMDSSEPYMMPLSLYIYCTLFSIFGNGIKENINFFFTSAENEDPYFWSDVVENNLVMHGPFLDGKQNHHKFSDLFQTNGFHEKTLDSVFSSLNVTARESIPRSMSVRKQALDMKRRLEAVIRGLRQLTTVDLDKLQDLRSLRKFFFRRGNIEEYDYVRSVKTASKVCIPFGKYATNCDDCEMTCHFECSCNIFGSIVDCDVMGSVSREKRSCLVCRCPWEAHLANSSNWSHLETEQMTTCGAIKEKYEKKSEKKLTKEEVLGKLDVDVATKKEDLLKNVKSLLQFVNELNEVNGFLKSEWDQQFISDNRFLANVLAKLIKVDQKDKQKNYRRRIKIFQNLFVIAECNSELKKKNFSSLSENEISHYKLQWLQASQALAQAEEQQPIEEEEENEPMEEEEEDEQTEEEEDEQTEEEEDEQTEEEDDEQTEEEDDEQTEEEDDEQTSDSESTDM